MVQLGVLQLCFTATKIIHATHCKFFNNTKAEFEYILYFVHIFCSRLIYYITKESPRKRNLLTKFPLNTINLNSCITMTNGYTYYDQANYQNFMGYIHTFAVTDNYIILPVTNYVVNPCYARPESRNGNGFRIN